MRTVNIRYLPQKKYRIKIFLIYIFVFSCYFYETASFADTLRDALAKAYSSNPVLNAARASQMATDENVSFQRAAALPSAQITSTYSESIFIPGVQYAVRPRSLQTELQVTIPVYQGGLVKNSIKSAEARVLAGADLLRATEASVFSQVVAAYMDVLRDTEIFEFNLENVANLEIIFKATEERKAAGDSTITDVAQSEARISRAQSDLLSAEANLVFSIERYIQQVGEAPGVLIPPLPLSDAPATVREAVEIALTKNADIAAAKKVNDAINYDVKVARAGRLPTVRAFGSVNRYDNFGGAVAQVPIIIPASQHSGILGVQLQIPLFQGGRPASQIRQAQAQQLAALENQIAVERDIIQQVRAAFAAHRTNIEIIVSAKKAIFSNTLSVESLKIESSVGSRTVIEVLNAEQELINSKVLLAVAKRNSYVAGFTLLAAMGSAGARDLGMENIQVSDPSINFKAVRNSISDWTDRPTPMARSSRTADQQLPALPDISKEDSLTILEPYN